MPNHTGKFLTKYHMAEAKRSEAMTNSVQKREKTNHPAGEHIAWSCECCVGVPLKYDQKILSKTEALVELKRRKTLDKHGTEKPVYISIEQLRQHLYRG